MIIFGQITSIMAKKDLEIRHGILDGRKDAEYFDLTHIPDNISELTNNCCNYVQIMNIMNETHHDCITIYPEEINAVTLVRLLHDTHGNYSSNTREIQRGGEFV